MPCSDAPDQHATDRFPFVTLYPSLLLCLRFLFPPFTPWFSLSRLTFSVLWLYPSILDCKLVLFEISPLLPSLLPLS